MYIHIFTVYMSILVAVGLSKLMRHPFEETVKTPLPQWNPGILKATPDSDKTLNPKPRV